MGQNCSDPKFPGAREIKRRDRGWSWPQKGGERQQYPLLQQGIAEIGRRVRYRHTPAAADPIIETEISCPMQEIFNCSTVWGSTRRVVTGSLIAQRLQILLNAPNQRLLVPDEGLRERHL